MEELGFVNEACMSNSEINVIANIEQNRPISEEYVTFVRDYMMH